MNDGTANVLINGTEHALQLPLTVAQLVTQLALTGKRIAVECNGQIVPKSQHAVRQIAPADRLEIVVAVGGG